MRDGGWAARQWELWQTVGRADATSGAWEEDWNAFQVAVPSTVLADDEQRLDLMRAMRICAGVMNGGAKGVIRDQPDDGD